MTRRLTNVRRVTARGFIAFCVCLCGPLAASAAAQAEGPESVHALGFTFGKAGAGAGEFANPAGIAVQESSGDVYVVDDGNNRVERFDSTGAYLGEFDGEGAPTGTFSEPEGIAVDNSQNPLDPSAGDVYVADIGHKVIDKFTPTGKYIGQLTELFEIEEEEELFVRGVAVAPSGDVWAYMSDAGVQEFNDAQANNRILVTSTFSGANPGLAVDSTGDLYFNSRGRILKFEVEPFYHELFPLDECECVKGLAVESSTNDLYVNQGASIAQYASSAERGGQPVEQFGAQALSGAGGSGIAVDSAHGRVYATDAAGNRVDAFVAIPLPKVAAGDFQLTNTGVEATLKGTIDLAGEVVVGCRFEFGIKGEQLTQSVPCSQGLPLSGSGAVSVSASAPLAAGGAYDYRLTGVYATAEGEVAVEGQKGTLITPSIVEGSAQASGVTSFAATLTGVLNSSEVTPAYRFVYGPTSAYGSSWPVPDANASTGGTQTVTQTLSGLHPNTTYHFALAVTNFGGHEVVGADETFTTRPLVAPAVSTGAAEAIAQTSVALTGAIGPEGLQTTYRFEYGVGAGYGGSWPLIAAAAGSGSGSQSVAVVVPNLQPGATYHYRLVASSEDGTSYGADQVFTTRGYPVSVIQQTPVLTTQLGFFNPEAIGKYSKSKGKRKAGKKGKHKAKSKRKERSRQGGRKR